MNTSTRQAGFALPAALLALVVVGALVTGGVYAAMAEGQASGNMSHGHFAFVAAERGIEDMMGTLDRPYFEDMGAVGTTDVIGPVAIEVGDLDAQYTISIHRLGKFLFKMDSEGEIVSGGRYAGTKREVSQMIKILHVSVPDTVAVTTQGPLRTRGKSGIIGVDSIPTGWTDCEDKGSRTAVLAKESDDIDIKGQTGLVGTPEKAEDATMDLDSFERYGDMELDDLRAMANYTLSPGGTYNGMAPTASGGVCNTTDTNNWGDPNNPAGACHTYWPIIYAPGDLKLSTGIGQGILIVDGNLQVTGNFEFTGIVFVRGDLKASGTGNKLAGSVNIYGTAVGTELGESTGGQGTGNTILRLSSCAIERAYNYNDRFSRPIPLGQRKYVDVSALGVT